MSSHRPIAAARVLLLTAALAAAGLVAGCGSEAEANKPAAAAAPTDPRLVTPPDSLAQRLKTGVVARVPVSEPLQVVGRVDFDEQSVARIGAAVTGRVTELYALPGQSVQAGEVLAQLHSAELATAQLALLKARAQRDLAGKAVERARTLLAADVIGSAELQRRENELAVAQVEERAATDQLRVMGVSPKAIAQTTASGAINSTSSIVSTVNGVLVERRVNRGQVVQPAEMLFTVADLSRVWVVAQVPESEIGRVRVGQPVKVEVAAQGIDAIEGHLVWVADIVNPETRTVTVRTEVANPKRQLRPAMLANMAIEPLPVERLVVPSSAVVREENVDHVFVKTDKGPWRLTPVKLGDEVNGLRAVRSGLVGGETIVIEGGFHLNNERKRAELGGAS
ncbi:efflux RND transporter periplasmic adaptor subunit [Aquabacterium sp. J223]|uniref:efflux RND transporter periplasmic adaptor subunit n=1 Tax=Aquabacterium sp. J223 TaxID=2898431 RepID=UPI0021ADCEF9|nr:efflux RND transporter periplasmic adaptor subunit [Aquabacterium sp. J223]UUX94961.1 efflux RND transporter periplasmic adaptor subunit [Aquabacterium sp. J223]